MIPRLIESSMDRTGQLAYVYSDDQGDIHHGTGRMRSDGTAQLDVPHGSGCCMEPAVRLWDRPGGWDAPCQ